MWVIGLYILYALLGLGVIFAVHRASYNAGHRVGWRRGFNDCRGVTHELVVALVDQLYKEKKA